MTIFGTTVRNAFKRVQTCLVSVHKFVKQLLQFQKCEKRNTIVLSIINARILSVKYHCHNISPTDYKICSNHECLSLKTYKILIKIIIFLSFWIFTQPLFLKDHELCLTSTTKMSQRIELSSLVHINGSASDIETIIGYRNEILSNHQTDNLIIQLLESIM